MMIPNLLNRRGFFRKYILPKTLYGRFVAIIIIPVLMVQVFTLWVFYDRHWQHTTKHMSLAIIRDVKTVIKNYKLDPLLAESIATDLNLSFSYDTVPVLNNKISATDITGDLFIEQYNQNKIGDYKAKIRFIEPSLVNLALQNHAEQYVFRFNEYRLYSNTTANLVWYWTLSIGFIFIIFALVIARNQARPIKNLSRSLIAFSQGDNEAVDKISLRGSNEIRTAIYNFKIMAGRITRQRKQRTNMLSGISHDLRTPLTRLKLLLAMMDTKDTQPLKDNIKDMEVLIDAYLSFVRGEKDEPPQIVHLHSQLKIISDKWVLAGHSVSFTFTDEVSLKLRLVSIQRMLENIIVNAIKFGDSVQVHLEKKGGNALISIIDNGCGIPDKKIQDVFSPFMRVDESRNTKTGGVGLGLTVSMDIATAHGGTITLHNLDNNQGLRVEITLPISIDT